MKKNPIKRGLQVISCLFILSACGPVNKLTQIKKVPKEYTRNFCCGDVAVPRSVDKRGPWIVYSDRNKNTTFYNPGGKVPLKEASYMEAFLVIGKKGEYLQLIKYKPDIIENGRLRNRKQAEYYGWMHRDNLLLTSNAVTDIATGNAIKMMTTLKDATPLEQAKKLLAEDSLLVYADPELLTPKGKIPFGRPVYLVKTTSDYDKSLIVGKATLSPDNSQTVVSGWTSSSMVIPFGQTFYMDYSSLTPAEAVTYTNQYHIAYPLPLSTYEKFSTQGANRWMPGLNAVNGISTSDSLVTIQTTLPVPVIDNTRNLVYSLSGSPITYKDFQKIRQDLNRINILLAFNGQKKIFENFKQIVAALQPLKKILGSSPNGPYRIGAIFGFNEKGENVFNEIPLNADVDAVLRAMEVYADSQQETSLQQTTDSWESLWHASRMLSPHKSETNIIVLIGENGNAERMDTNIVNTLAESNCRIAGYQLYSEGDDLSNNFVLQVEHLIDRLAEKRSKTKRDILVRTEQTCPSNQYAEYAENIYRIDFPKVGMTQGWIAFPKKKEQLPQDLILTVTTSLLKEVEADNQDIIAHIEQAFHESGMGRSQVDPLWMSLVNRRSEQIPAKGVESFASVAPVTFFPMTLKVPNTELDKGKYFFLLTEAELKKLRDFMADLTRIRVDYKYTPTSTNKKSKSRTCPERLFEVKLQNDTLSEQEYLNTAKVRKSMTRSYVKWAREDKVYPARKKEIKALTLSQAQQLIFFKPSFHPHFRYLLVKNLKDKKEFPDSELDKLMDYLLSKRKELEEAIVPQNKTEVNGETYYKIEADILP